MARSITPLPLTTPNAPGKPAAANVPGSREAKAWRSAQDFEGVFLNTMFSQMFSNVGDEGPLGGKMNEAWRSMMVDEHAKSVAAKGGIGLAPQVYRELVGQQEAAPRRLPAAAISAYGA